MLRYKKFSKFHEIFDEKSFLDRVVSKNILTDSNKHRLVAVDRSLGISRGKSRFHENIFVCVTRSDQQRDDSTENDESAVSLRLIPPFLPFSFRVFKINTIDAPPLHNYSCCSNVRKYSRCKLDLRQNFYSCYISDYNSRIIFR